MSTGAWKSVGGSGKDRGERSRFDLVRWIDSKATFLIILSSLASILVCALAASTCYPDHAYPKVGNLFQYGVRLEYAQDFSKWDVVGFTADVQDRVPEMAGTLRALNPEIVLLAYFPVGIIWAEPDTTNPTVGPFWRKVRDNDWWLYDDRGHRLLYRDDYYFLNASSKCARDESGLTLAEWVAEYLADQVMATGFWDGLILDALSEQISWVNGFPNLFEELPAGVDCDRDGVIDDPDSLDLWWKTGAETCLSVLRREAGPSAIIVPNGNNHFYAHANGRIRENFPHMHGGWQENMFGPYGYIPGCEDYLDQPMNLTLILCYWNSEDFDLFNAPTSVSFEKFNRFTLASALMGDGYYFLDGGRASLWWRDYYDLGVGTPLGPAYLDSLPSALDHLERPVWRRDFTNATVLCNPYQQYLTLDDGTWLFPEDGQVTMNSLPGEVSIALDRRASERRFDRKQRSISCQAIVANPNPEAAQPYRWMDLLGPQGTVVSGLPARCLVGAQAEDTLTLGLRIPTSLGLGEYCIRVSVAGPDRIPICIDTMHVTKVLDFEKDGKPVSDGDGTGYTCLEEDGLGVFPRPVLISAENTLRMDVNELTSAGDFCSVKIYDVAGRLVDTVFEGRAEPGLVLAIGDDGSGAFRVPGVYFLHIETRDKAATHKIVLLR